MNGSSVRTWPALAVALCSAVLISLLLFATSELPNPLATHWGRGGKPDGAMPRELLLGVLAAGLLALGGFAQVAKAPRSRATLAVITYSVSALFTVMTWSIVLHNRGAAHWTQAAPLTLQGTIPLLVAVVCPMLIGFRAYRRLFQTRDPGHVAPALDLSPSERAVWLGTAHNHWLWLVTLPVLSLVVISRVVPRGTPSIAPLIAIAVTLLLSDAFSFVRVRIDRKGMSIIYGHLGLIRQKLALDRIAQADTFVLVPMSHGGWGYRGSLLLLKRAAIVVRAGSALRIALNDGKQLSVTVDDAESAAALVNGLVRLR